MQSSESSYPTYKYVLFPGNNSSIIGSSLTKRKVWSAIDKQKILDADFVWSPLNFPEELYDNAEETMRYDRNKKIILNHFQHNRMICTKSGLVRSLRHYYSHDNGIYQQNYHLFETVPTTFIICPNKLITQFKDFSDRFTELQAKNFSKQKMPIKHCEKNIWYIKPEALNQGRGISLSNNLREIESAIFSKVSHTAHVLQKAVEKPLLFNGRKFDVRVWALVTSNLQIYFYGTPYIRTSSYQYDDEKFDQYIHLTNNCLQKHLEQYSKYQEGNTIPFSSLRDILLGNGKYNVDELMERITERMKNLVVDCILSVRKFFLRNTKKKQFQLFGFDFLIDQDLRTWLLEVNNNPYLGIPNQFIKQLLPQMIDEMLQIVLDPYFPPFGYQPVKQKRYQLLHKQINLYRINMLRCSKSLENRRKNCYPLQDNISRATLYVTSVNGKNKRSNEFIHHGCSFGSTSNNMMKSRYPTPVQTLKTLLDTYLFNDFAPFIIPASLILTSPKLQQKDYFQISLHNLKLITETRICPILLQPKFVQICIGIFQSPTQFQQIKTCLLNGYTSVLNNYRSRAVVIRNIVQSLKKLLTIHNRRPDPQGLIKEDPLIESVILLLVKLGQILNRKIFIPGETREKQRSRHLFIVSSTMDMLMNLKSNFPSLCKDKIQEVIKNLNQKDWELYNSTGKTLPNQRDSTTTINNPIIVDRHSRNSLHDRRFSLRQKIQIHHLKNHGKGDNIQTLPKLNKMK